MRDLFPFLSAQPEANAQGLPLFCDVAVDYTTGLVRFASGEPVQLYGHEAVLSWAYRMLKTSRYRFSHFSRDIGCELDRLVGLPYREDTRLAECTRYVSEALLTSPYIRTVEVESARMTGAELRLQLTIKTIYGEGRLHV